MEEGEWQERGWSEGHGREKGEERRGKRQEIRTMEEGKEE